MKSKARKQREAQERQRVYDSLTYGEKLNRIIQRPGKSEKETKRLSRKHAKEVQINNKKNGGLNEKSMERDI